MKTPAVFLLKLQLTQTVHIMSRKGGQTAITCVEKKSQEILVAVNSDGFSSFGLFVILLF